MGNAISNNPTVVAITEMNPKRPNLITEFKLSLKFNYFYNFSDIYGVLKRFVCQNLKVEIQDVYMFAIFFNSRLIDLSIRNGLAVHSEEQAKKFRKSFRPMK